MLKKLIKKIKQQLEAEKKETVIEKLRQKIKNVDDFLKDIRYKKLIKNYSLDPYYENLKKKKKNLKPQK